MKIALGEEGTLMFQTVQYSLRKKKVPADMNAQQAIKRERGRERESTILCKKSVFYSPRNLEKNVNVNKDYAINIVK